jgi:hypothetical protein
VDGTKEKSKKVGQKGVWLGQNRVEKTEKNETENRKI